MSEAPDLRSVFEAAEHAAAAGDYLSAERHLREAAAQQEATVGPLHPDLANTLNNLGVVYETLDRPDDAERCYRRAYSIATTSLPVNHPFIATSEKNLRDFCNARGKAFEPRAPLPEITLTSAPLVTQPEPRLERAPGLGLRLRQAALLAGVALVALLTVRFWLGGREPVVESERAAAPPPSDVAAPAPLPQRSEPPPRSEPAAENLPAPPVKAERPKSKPAPAPAPRATAERPTATAAAKTTRPPAAVPAGVVPALVEANVCRTVREWRCEPPGSPVGSGQLFFYTRVKSPGSTTVEHRWYRGDRLHRSVTLRIQENQRSGFRTYSRTSVNAGDWRVELRARDGAVLHTENFTVR